MKKQIILYSIIAIGTFSLPSCKEKEDSRPASTTPVYGCTDTVSINYNPSATVDDGSCQYAGIGGNVNIVAFPQHHHAPIIGHPGNLDTAFIKYNTQYYPGSSSYNYDTVIVGLVGDDHVVIPNMKSGKYFILMTGYDTTISESVKGGIPFIVTQTSGIYSVAVPVTE